MHSQINMIGLFVDNLENMVDFYSRVLNFKIIWDGEGPYAEFQTDSVRFTMYQRDALSDLINTKLPKKHAMNAVFELSVDFATDEELDLSFMKVDRQRVRILYPPRLEPWGMRSAMILDPEGNIIELTCINTNQN